MSAERLTKAEREAAESYERMRTACVWAYGEDHVAGVEREIKDADRELDDWLLQRMCMLRRQQEIVREG